MYESMRMHELLNDLTAVEYKSLNSKQALKYLFRIVLIFKKILEEGGITMGKKKNYTNSFVIYVFF